MKVLVNKANPAIRITAPEIIEEEEYYTWDGEKAFLKENWILVEEEPKDLEKAAEDYVMQTASGTAEEMENMKKLSPSDGARIYSNAINDLVDKLNQM